MLHFFRRIRQSLLSDNRFRKYTIYALGEIALVMIGILLALQVNNWNEQRKSFSKESQALLDLHKEFAHSIADLRSMQKTRIEQEHQFRDFYILLADPSISSKEKAKSTFPIVYDGVWAPSLNTLRGMISSGSIDNIQNDSLKVFLSAWPSTVKDYTHFENEFLDRLNEMELYANEHVPRFIVKPGDYGYSLSDWPGNYYPHDLQEQRDQAMVSLVDDIKYRNYMSEITTEIYISLIIIRKLLEQYDVIERMITLELHARNLEVPTLRVLPGTHE